MRDRGHELHLRVCKLLGPMTGKEYQPDTRSQQNQSHPTDQKITIPDALGNLGGRPRPMLQDQYPWLIRRTVLNHWKPPGRRETSPILVLQIAAVFHRLPELTLQITEGRTK